MKNEGRKTRGGGGTDEKEERKKRNMTKKKNFLRNSPNTFFKESFVGNFINRKKICTYLK